MMKVLFISVFLVSIDSTVGESVVQRFMEYLRSSRDGAGFEMHWHTAREDLSEVQEKKVDEAILNKNEIKTLAVVGLMSTTGRLPTIEGSNWAVFLVDRRSEFLMVTDEIATKLQHHLQERTAFPVVRVKTGSSNAAAYYPVVSVGTSNGMEHEGATIQPSNNYHHRVPVGVIKIDRNIDLVKEGGKERIGYFQGLQEKQQ